MQDMDSHFSRRYLSSPFGQTHWLLRQPADTSRPPLLCLHPIPYSGVFFRTFMGLVDDRETLAPDYPGYGGSDGADEVISIKEHAQAIAPGIETFKELHVLGFHTGCLVGVELALSYPSVTQLTLVDIPYFEAEARSKMTVSDHELTPELSCLESLWSFSVSRNVPDLALTRAYELFIEQARAGERERWGFKAAFAYPCEERFAKVTTPTTIIATESGLKDPTITASQAMSHATFRQRPDINALVFETFAAEIAAEL